MILGKTSGPSHRIKRRGEKRKIGCLEEGSHILGRKTERNFSTKQPEFATNESEQKFELLTKGQVPKE